MGALASHVLRTKGASLRCEKEFIADMHPSVSELVSPEFDGISSVLLHMEYTRASRKKCQKAMHPPGGRVRLGDSTANPFSSKQARDGI